MSPGQNRLRNCNGQGSARARPPGGLPSLRYHVYRRPYLTDFLNRVRSDFDLAVWSSASDDYVTADVEHLFGTGYPLRCGWGRSRATLMRLMPDEYGYADDPWDHRRYLKPLKKVSQMG